VTTKACFSSGANLSLEREGESRDEARVLFAEETHGGRLKPIIIAHANAAARALGDLPIPCAANIFLTLFELHAKVNQLIRGMILQQRSGERFLTAPAGQLTAAPATARVKKSAFVRAKPSSPTFFTTRMTAVPRDKNPHVAAERTFLAASTEPLPDGLDHIIEEGEDQHDERRGNSKRGRSEAR
jgi:hypothetical protein